MFLSARPSKEKRANLKYIGVRWSNLLGESELFPRVFTKGEWFTQFGALHPIDGERTEFTWYMHHRGYFNHKPSWRHPRKPMFRWLNWQ